MGCISTIDCTLRDGGYVNNWQFDEDFQKSLIKALILSRVEMIECGFISQTSGSDYSGTHFRSIEKINEFLRVNLFNIQNAKFLVMMRLGEYDVQTLPVCDRAENCVTGIRVMVAKDEIEKSVSLLRQIAEKGYNVHIQPTIISNYTNEEIVQMLNAYQGVNYRAISIVDTFGSLKEDDIKRIAYLFDKYANKDAMIAFHAHNNLNIAYQNAISFTHSVTNLRDIFIDCSVGGIGRGAGNLSSEILLTYLKNEKNKDYVVFPVRDFGAKFMDFERNISEHDFYAYILTAKKNMHPNYASYLLTEGYSRPNIIKMLELIEPEKYPVFDYAYITGLCEVCRIKV